MYRVDLHTHSVGSPDGGITLAQYRAVLDSGALDYVAITDHNTIDTALLFQKELGEQIIVGEEIMSTSGEIIGLYLESSVPAHLTPLETAKRIKEQQGIVYVPHPFETIRKGLHPAVLEELIDYVDAIEVYNGRSLLQDRSEQAVVWAKLNKVVGVASSDAHGVKGVGATHTRIAERPTRETLLSLLASGTPMAGKPSLRALLYPKYHILRQKLRRKLP